MSEAQLRTASDLTDSVITITEKLQDLYNAASPAQELGEAFRTISQHTPLVLDVLRSCKRAQEQAYLEYTKTTDASRRSDIELINRTFEILISGCQRDAEKLQENFGEIDPSDDAADTAEQDGKIPRARMRRREEKAQGLMIHMLETLLETRKLVRDCGLFSRDNEQRNEYINHWRKLKIAIVQLSELQDFSAENQTQNFHSGNGVQRLIIGKFDNSFEFASGYEERCTDRSHYYNGDFSFGTSKYDA